MRFINQYGCGPVTGELTAVDVDAIKTILLYKMGLIYPDNKLPVDLCAGPVMFRYMKRSKYVVEIIQMGKTNIMRCVCDCRKQ